MNGMTDVIGNRRRFIEALRSGKNSQTKGMFMSAVDKDCLCALGVAAVACGNNRIIDSYETQDGHEARVYVFEEAVGPFVTGMMNLTEHEINSIINMNDFQGLGFSAIADRLEERWGLKETKETKETQNDAST